MPLAKLNTTGTLNAIKSEGNDSLDTFIGQTATAKEPFLSFSRPGESPVQWIQLLHALDQPGTARIFSRVLRLTAQCGSYKLFLRISSLWGFRIWLPFEIWWTCVLCCGQSKNGTNFFVEIPSEQAVRVVSCYLQQNVCSWSGILITLAFPFCADLPGWPLLTPLKVQMQKCEKCSREFFSLINYRRHIRVHRRSLNVDKVVLATHNFHSSNQKHLCNLAVCFLKLIALRRSLSIYLFLFGSMIRMK